MKTRPVFNPWLIWFVCHTYYVVLTSDKLTWVDAAIISLTVLMSVIWTQLDWNKIAYEIGKKSYFRQVKKEHARDIKNTAVHKAPSEVSKVRHLQSGKDS